LPAYGDFRRHPGAQARGQPRKQVLAHRSRRRDYKFRAFLFRQCGQRLRVRVGQIVLQRGMRQRDYLGDAVLGDFARRRLRRVARHHRDRFAAALFRQLEARVNRSQRGLGEMSPLMLRENQNVTHVNSLRRPRS